MSQQPLIMISGMEAEEMLYIKQITESFTESQQQQFYAFYAGRRKDQQQMLLLTVIGFFGVAGLQRIITGDVGLGIVYLVTLGFCGVGTIIDLINIKSMTNAFNRKQAAETVQMVALISK